MPIPEARKLAIVQGVIGMGIIGALAYVGLGLRPPAVPGRNRRSTWAQFYGAFAEGSGLTGMGVADSPVKIVGGSMTFRSKLPATWSSSGLAWTTTTVNNPTLIQLEGVASPGVPSGPGSVTIPNITVPWQIAVYARSADGSLSAAGVGVYVCAGPYVDPKTPCNLTGDLSNTIYIGPMDPQASGNIGFYPTTPFGDVPTILPSQTDPGKRYNDKTCTTQGSFCEHIGQIQITFKGGGSPSIFNCPDASCRVYIGQ
jgi:hypothetical protein